MRAERGGLAPRLGIPLRGTAVLGGILTLAFVIVCRPDPSVLRAAACGLVTLLAIGTGRRRSLIPALAAAVLLLVLYDPWLARSYGFLLSVLATGSLLTLGPRWSEALQGRGSATGLAEVLGGLIAAQAVCAPVIVVMASRVGLVAVPCNLLAELAVGPATVLGFAALATAPVAMPAATARPVRAWPAGWIAAVARGGASLPGAQIGWPGGWPGGLLLAAVTAALVAAVPDCAGTPGPAPPARFCCCSQSCGPHRSPGSLPAGRRHTGSTRCATSARATPQCWPQAPISRRIDGRPASGRPLSRDLGVIRIPLLLLTHFHADHVAGLPGVLHGRAVGAIETTALQAPREQSALVTERQRLPMSRSPRPDPASSGGSGSSAGRCCGLRAPSAGTPAIFGRPEQCESDAACWGTRPN